MAGHVTGPRAIYHRSQPFTETRTHHRCEQDASSITCTGRGLDDADARGGRQGMSWDVFVQDLPADTRSVHDIPDDFSPGPIGRRSDIVRGITEVVPSVDFADPTLGVITADDYTIEIGLSDADPVRSFAFHVRGSAGAVDVVADILDHLGLRALDPGAADGIFSRAEARASMTGWQEYRDEALET